MQGVLLEKMVIYRDPERKAEFFREILFMAGTILGWSLLVFIWLLAKLHDYGWVIVTPLYFILGLAIFGVIYMTYMALLKWNSPVIVLDQEGVWVRHFRRIAWRDIAEVGPPSPVFTDIKIRLKNPVKNPARIAINADWEGRVVFFLTKIGGKLNYNSGYHISATGLDTPNDVIIAFAHQYMPRDTQN